MPGYNKTFELTIDDVDLIESALRQTERLLSASLIDQARNPMEPGEDIRSVNASMKRINDLLGRLHNQKNFYRPKNKAYVGG